MLFMAPSLIMPYMIHNRIGNLVSSDGLEEDRKVLNEGNPFFPVATKYRYETDNLHAYFKCADNNDYQDDYCDKGQIFTRFGRMESPMSYMTGEQLHEFYVKNLDKAKALTQIKKFIEVSEKYGGDINTKPNEILAEFVKGKHNFYFNTDKLKKKITTQLWDIEAHQYPYISSSDTYSFWGTLLICISFFSILFHLIKSVSLRDLIISAVTLVGLGIGTTVLVVTVTEFRSVFDMRGEEFGSLFVLGLYGIALYQTAGIGRIKTYSRVKTIMLTMVSLVTPMLLVWLAFIGDAWQVIDIRPNYEFMVTTTLVGLTVYGLLFFPWFRKLQLRMHSLPKG